MKKIYLALSLLCTYGIQAQNFEYNYTYDFVSNQYREIAIPKELEGTVTSVKLLTKTKKHSTSSEFKYNSSGKVTESIYYGKKTRNSKTEYTSEGLVKQYAAWTNGELTYEKTNLFDANNRVVESTVKKKGEKISARNTWEFGEGKCPLSSKRYGKGGQKLLKVWEYSYYSPCDRSKTELKNAKGKILKTWTYDCKKEGEQLQKKKDETQVCKWEENDGKYLTKVYQNFDEKGRIQKTVSKYNSADTSIAEHSTFDGNDKLKSKSTYLGSYDKQTSWESFSKKGERQVGIYKEYNQGKLVKEEYFIKQKKTKVTSYEYNEKGLLTKKETIGKKGKVTSSSIYEYVF